MKIEVAGADGTGWTRGWFCGSMTAPDVDACMDGGAERRARVPQPLETPSATNDMPIRRTTSCGMDPDGHRTCRRRRATRPGGANAGEGWPVPRRRVQPIRTRGSSRSADEAARQAPRHLARRITLNDPASHHRPVPTDRLADPRERPAGGTASSTTMVEFVNCMFTGLLSVAVILAVLARWCGCRRRDFNGWSPRPVADDRPDRPAGITVLADPVA